MNSELHNLNAIELGKLILEGKTSSYEVTQHILNRIHQLDPVFKCFVKINSDVALESAKRLDKEIQKGIIRGPLHGVPIALKDIFFTKDEVTSNGSPSFSHFIPEFSATVVTRLEEAGLVFLGKTKMTECAFASHHPSIEPPINPWNKEAWAGVSSSGSAVAIAAGLSFGSLGTDTGGSIRTPCAYNGLVGIKPTYGRVSRYGAFELAPSIDHILNLKASDKTPVSSF